MAVQPVGRRESVQWPTLTPSTSVIHPLGRSGARPGGCVCPQPGLSALIPPDAIRARLNCLRFSFDIVHLRCLTIHSEVPTQGRRDGRRKYSGRTSRSSSVIENARLGLNNYSDHVSQKEGLDCHCIKGVRRATRDVAEAGHAEMWARVEKHSAAPRTPWRFESEACGRTVSYIDSSRRLCGTVLEPEFIGKTF